MTATFYVGDAVATMNRLPEKSVDLVLTSPPFLALRSYLPADHPDKALEGGSQSTPGEFIDWLLDVVEACDRVLAPHGSLCIELGDTYSGSGGGGGDYLEGGWREGQAQFAGSAAAMRESNAAHWRQKNQRGKLAEYSDARGNPAGMRDTTFSGGNTRTGGGTGWPLAKSLSLIPETFRWAMVYGHNPFTGRQTELWRLRNVVRWCLDGDTVVYARTPKGVGPVRLLHLTQNWQPGQWDLWDGTRWTPVLGWSTTETDDAVEIEFRNGEKVSATRNHEWPTQRGLVTTDDLRIGDVVASTTLPDSPGEPDHLPDEDIGWLVGTFLADGSFDSRNRMQISGHRDEGAARHVRLQRIARAYDGTASRYEHGTGLEGNVVVRSYILAAIVRRYIGGDGARNKHLLPATWRRSNHFLTAVLTAYLDGDGHYDVKNDRWRLGFTDNIWLARDLRTIAARLGIVCRIRRQPRAKDPRGGQFAGAATFWHRGEIRMLPGPKVSPPGEVVGLRLSKRRRFFDVGVEGDPHLFALASGILTHNCRPNPPVGALGDKFRPATSELMVFCKSAKRYFDLDSVRYPSEYHRESLYINKETPPDQRPNESQHTVHPAGAPPLDWWNIPPGGYEGAHYAVWPPELCVKPVKAMCPEKVCRTCGEPSRRIVETEGYRDKNGVVSGAFKWESGVGKGKGAHTEKLDDSRTAVVNTLGFTDCGHDDWRPGLVLDPFAGSGTTLAVATGHGRDAIGIDLDERNFELALGRVGPLVMSRGEIAA